MRIYPHFLTLRVAHPYRLISISVIFVAVLLAAFAWYNYPYKSRCSPIEAVLWTSDQTRTTFYGPGTPQPLKYAAILNQYALPEKLAYSGSVYVAPLDGVGTDPEEINIISPFNPSAALQVKQSHEKQIKIHKKQK